MPAEAGVDDLELARGKARSEGTGEELGVGFPMLGTETPHLVETEFVIGRAELLELQDADLRAMCSLDCVVSWPVEASPTKAPEGARRRDVAQIEDGIVRTGWNGRSREKRFRVFRNESPVVEILLRDKMDPQECSFDSIAIKPGVESVWRFWRYFQKRARGMPQPPN